MKCQKCGKNNANTHIKTMTTKNMICVLNVQRKWAIQQTASSLTLVQNLTVC